MSDIPFKLVDVEKKPSRKYRKGSKYDSILEKFIDGKSKLVKVVVTGKDANYLRTQLKKRINACDLNNEIEISVVNNIAYLEKK